MTKAFLIFMFVFFFTLPLFAQVDTARLTSYNGLEYNPNFIQGDSIPFAPAVNYGAGTLPSSVFCADLDGDTHFDLTVTNAASNNVSILKNNGNGTFQTAVNYGVGVNPKSVFCADLDGDTHFDLAVANRYSSNVSILKNNGNGTFQSAVNYGTGWNCFSVFCADLDADGDSDIAAANAENGKVSILKNNGNGTFQTKVDYGAGSGPLSVFCADLDGDTDLDLAVANQGSDNVSILKNNGNGTFQTAVNYSVGDEPWSVFSADLDGDNKSDLAVANARSNNVSVLKNNGNGTFQTAVNYGVGLFSNSIFCADLDKDADLDLVVTNQSSNSVSVLKNNGDGTFHTAVNYSVSYPYYVFCADLDGDSDLDVAVAGYHFVSILINLTTEEGGFRPNPDGWQFANITSDMWPVSWWSQFDYTQPQYPYAWRFFCNSADFPDWPLFAEAFGESQCYWNPPPGLIVYSPIAVQKWMSIKDTWGGSCFGFGVSSLLYFNDYFLLSNTFPEYSTVYEVPLSDSSRKLVNKYWIYQFGKEHLAYRNANYKKSAVETLNDLKQMLLVQGLTNRSLSLRNQNTGEGHGVVACSLAKDAINPNKYHVFIYDNNYPGSYEIIDIDSAAGTWSYDNMPEWGGPTGIFLRDPIDTYVPNPKLSKELPDEQTSLGSPSNTMDFIEIYNSSYADIMIRNSIGESIGYSNSDSTLIDSMENASPIIPEIGTQHPAIGYFLPNNMYTAQISNSVDTTLYFSVFAESSVFAYDRNDFQTGQTDNLKYFDNGKQLQINTVDPEPKNITLKSISVQPDRETVCDIQNLILSQNDSIQVEIVDQAQFKLTNTGTSKSYKLTLELASANMNPIFVHDSISMSEFSSHQIAPNWEELDTLAVPILIDTNLDGYFDDTLLVENQYAHVKDETGVREKPSDFTLCQNYPNPFNQNTKMEFTLAKSCFVSLNIYNVTGRKIRTLVSEHLSSGYKSVLWDGKDDFGKEVASGIYFYRLKVGDFSETKKLTLLK